MTGERGNRVQGMPLLFEFVDVHELIHLDHAVAPYVGTKGVRGGIIGKFASPPLLLHSSSRGLLFPNYPWVGNRPVKP